MIHNNHNFLKGYFFGITIILLFFFPSFAQEKDKYDYLINQQQGTRSQMRDFKNRKLFADDEGMINIYVILSMM